MDSPIPNLKVVQLLGALGARIKEYDAHSIVRRLSTKLYAESLYLNAPFWVENKTIAKSLMENKSVKETLNFARVVDVALLGVGTSDINHCSYYLAGFVSEEEILDIRKTGAVGDVCGRFFNINGNLSALEFHDRLIGISCNDLMHIPLRIGAAGGAAKIDPIIGALRNGLINILVSDEYTISEVLKRTNGNYM